MFVLPVLHLVCGRHPGLFGSRFRCVLRCGCIDCVFVHLRPFFPRSLLLYLLFGQAVSVCRGPGVSGRLPLFSRGVNQHLVGAAARVCLDFCLSRAPFHICTKALCHAVPFLIVVRIFSTSDVVVYLLQASHLPVHTNAQTPPSLCILTAGCWMKAED